MMDEVRYEVKQWSPNMHLGPMAYHFLSAPLFPLFPPLLLYVMPHADCSQTGSGCLGAVMS